MSEPDLTEFEQYKSKRPRRRCAVALALESLKGEDRAALKAAVDAKGRISGLAIQKWCAAREIDCGLQWVSAHRRGVCSCG